jgi:hypothetical protein
VLTDTTRITKIDTTRIVITDTLRVSNEINEIVFDTLYNFVDTIIVKEVIKNANANIKTTFNYDTILAIKNKLVALKIIYDGLQMTINIDEKQLIDSVIVKQKEQEIRTDYLKIKWWWFVIVGGIVAFLFLKIFGVFFITTKRSKTAYSGFASN